ncbi:hypothetical protein BDR06DRAFT_949810 [Suillus hirtellus]|nr:hypothetical protein BDR06DRAFT_949810 [Suillus hirtellus]
MGQPIVACCNTRLASLVVSYTLAGRTSYAVCNTGPAHMAFTNTLAKSGWASLAVFYTQAGQTSCAVCNTGCYELG